jgi:small subunit ribosomal protein S2
MQEEYELSVVTMKSLLESGVHFGHQTRRWDPRMKKFIFAERNGIHIIDLQKSIVEIKKAYEIVRKAVLNNKQVLFVGTKKQARSSVAREAERCGQFFINNRWLGGMLTNFTTIKKSIARLKKIEKMEVDGTFDSVTKKERLMLRKEKEKLEKNLGGIKNMNGLPGLVFIIDAKKETIAVDEARKLGIPIVGVVDTNCNPDLIDHPIPGNDDAIRAINLYCSIIANACIDAENELGSAQMFENEGEEADSKDEAASDSTGQETVAEKKEAPVEKKEAVEEKPADLKAEVKEEKTEVKKEKPVEEKKAEVKKEEVKEETKSESKGDGSSMDISAKDVKKLRDMTNCGMMDCKKALIETKGDMDAALKFLKEKGLADAKKRSDRETKEGGVFIKTSGNKIAMITLACETDFVSSNEIFLKTSDEILDKVISSGNTDVAAYESDVQEAITQIKENIGLKSIKLTEISDSQFAESYIHGKNKIGVVSIFDIEKPELADSDVVKEMAKNVCMHIAASSPFYLTRDEVPESEVKEQQDIFEKQMADSDKPANVLENIIKGKMNKHFSEICLIDQKYVKDDKVSVEKYIESVAKDAGGKITISAFIRQNVGA